jgi:hypothetical protein
MTSVLDKMKKQGLIEIKEKNKQSKNGKDSKD